MAPLYHVSSHLLERVPLTDGEGRLACSKPQQYSCVLSHISGMISLGLGLCLGFYMNAGNFF